MKYITMCHVKGDVDGEITVQTIWFSAEDKQAALDKAKKWCIQYRTEANVYELCAKASYPEVCPIVTEVSENG